MSGEIEDGYGGGLESIFKQLAKRIFIGDTAFSGLKALKDKKLKLKAVKNNYFCNQQEDLRVYSTNIRAISEKEE